MYALNQFADALCSLDGEGALDFAEMVLTNVDYEGVAEV